MTEINLSSFIAASPSICFDLATNIDVHLESDRGFLQAVEGVTSGQIGLGESVTWEAKKFGIKTHMTSKIMEFDSPNRFVDQMIQGPFASWHHEHLFVERDRGTAMLDRVAYSAPFGIIGMITDAIYLKRYMTGLLMKHNAEIKRRAEQ